MNLDDIKNSKELGDYLRSLRLEKNISLEEIYQETKIRIKYLKAIEDGDFEAIPGGEVYLKGFLKNYAEAIGIDSSEILKKYKEISAPKSEESSQEKAENSEEILVEREKATSKASKMKIPLLIGVLVLIIALVFIALSTAKAPSNTSSVKPGETYVPGEAPSIEDSSPDQEIGEEIKEELPDQVILVSDDGRNVTYTVSGSSIYVNFEVTKDRCWIRVTADDEVTFEGTLRQGDSKTFEADKKLSIRIGNPLAVKVTLNGQEIELSGNSAKTLSIMRKE
ncbi:MAG: DUF4115 domain-containing protein [Bacillota bacterium]|nr:MAG: hypothetical protein DIU66_02895 [Bacillota bacterium]